VHSSYDWYDIVLYNCSESGDDADDEKEKLSTLEPLTVETNTNTLTVSDDANDKHYVKALRLTSEELVSKLV